MSGAQAHGLELPWWGEHQHKQLGWTAGGQRRSISGGTGGGALGRQTHLERAGSREASAMHFEYKDEPHHSSVISKLDNATVEEGRNIVMGVTI